MTEPNPLRYRVVQWATGTIGRYALRAIIEHPHMVLAGVYVHGVDKVGRDAGELCGTTSTGVMTTNSLDDIVDLRPDCVLYMPSVLDLAEVCRLLASGINVVTTCGTFHHPPSLDPDIGAKVQRACDLGGASIHSTGSSPGFITEAIPLVLTSIQRRIDGLTIDEYADLSQRNSPELLFDVMGFGRPAGVFEQFRADYLRSSFGPSLRLVADAIGLPLDAVEASGELATASTDTTIAAGTLPAGSTAAQRITIAGLRAGKTLLQFRATWYCTTDFEPAWDVRDTGWHVSVDGDAPLEVDIRMPIPLDRMAAVTPAYTANRAVNALPYVCSAGPGIHTTFDLPQVVTALDENKVLLSGEYK
ncbi:dihydrodipicolinate reductase [Mycobacterium sp.]|uniref:NAD(P)H-dependent amine dehydrogenase family protein n=1 Tax=Mycobacterium sp. TaxID=1785 RepID=UPI002D966506|nr:dihydrodipicolinate reductase [Mycobacterium sp.]